MLIFFLQEGQSCFAKHWASKNIFSDSRKTLANKYLARIVFYWSIFLISKASSLVDHTLNQYIFFYQLHHQLFRISHTDNSLHWISFFLWRKKTFIFFHRAWLTYEMEEIKVWLIVCGEFWSLPFIFLVKNLLQL